ncbi:MAG: hypothetical protein NDI61_09725 [Bdellovibrionaceae bacterium]|nr:hypothetical protein [Pseudobdellovibrionaceae bacterium]
MKSNLEIADSHQVFRHSNLISALQSVTRRGHTYALICLLSVTCFSLSTEAARGAPRPRSNSDSPSQFDLRWGAGLNLAQWHYEEPGLMKEYGSLVGISAFVGARIAESSQKWRVEFDYLVGEITYDGQFSDGTPVVSGARDKHWTLKGLYGWIYMADSFQWTPYFGIAARNVNDVIEGVGGYERNTTQAYLPLGLEFERTIIQDWNARIQAELDFLITGTVESHLSQASPTRIDVTNRQSDGVGLRLSATLSRSLESFDLWIQPYYQYWDIEDSELVPTEVPNSFALEPANTSHLTGIILGATF